MSEDIVYFLTPDGQKVSNDPRFTREQEAKAREGMLAGRPNTGTIGVPRDEQEATSGPPRLANLNSGQPGVGENPVPDDPEELVPAFGTGRQANPAAAAEADEKGASAHSPEVNAPEPEDSNKRVLQVRKEREERREKALKARAALVEANEEPGDPEVPYSEWSANQLKAEVTRRNAERDEADLIDTKGVKKKSELAERLQADDERQAQ